MCRIHIYKKRALRLFQIGKKNIINMGKETSGIFRKTSIGLTSRGS